jgi:hypothetical protein
VKRSPRLHVGILVEPVVRPRGVVLHAAPHARLHGEGSQC